MITVISPAKSLDYESPLATKQKSQPRFLEQSQELIDQLQELAPQDIASLMKLSDKLAVLNYDRFQEFSTPFTPENARQALLAFKGDVYVGLEAATFSADDFKYAQKHLRILSGLYGILRPLDLMQPYRLEMGTKFANNGGKNLYEFWGNRLNESLQKELKAQENPVLVNLASNEYFKAVKAKTLPYRIVTPNFKDYKNGQYKMISFFAKKARGLMSRFIIQNQIDHPEGIKDFNLEGYYFDKKSSTEDDWIFLRDEVA
ncbi:peroxide stress protein YaaA [Aliikangiella sp. G2MR2-5]|uniref:peroxide stress protein YaaA n=1 Tax=Aliikangiella sp. G2MR2-5 TaxID=2788943 RepID=UPI0018AB1E2A|nr:peroxide stress protein YaaA [Aliikangiella sp. G2MR2-5]